MLTGVATIRGIYNAITAMGIQEMSSLTTTE
jgi:hypothetical protein